MSKELKIYFPLFSDTLLCHDDELEGRRIAYIFYLVNAWTEQEGGTLDLYNVDGIGLFLSAFTLNKLVGLEFNSPFNAVKVMSCRLVYLTTLFLGKLNPLSC